MLTVNVFNHEYSMTFFPKTREKARLFTLTTFIQHSAEVLANEIKEEMERSSS